LLISLLSLALLFAFIRRYIRCHTSLLLRHDAAFAFHVYAMPQRRHAAPGATASAMPYMMMLPYVYFSMRVKATTRAALLLFWSAGVTARGDVADVTPR